MPITIYGVYRSRASRNIWMCLEAGIPFRLKPVFQPDRTMPAGAWTTKSPEFLAVNPAGMIPCVKDGRLVLSESLAINLYLARNYPSALGPKTAAEDALMTQWTLWAGSVMEPHAIQVLYHRTGNPHGPKEPAKADAAVEALRRHFAVLDAHLAAKGGFMVGKRFTVADINVAEVARYAMPAPELFKDAPHVDAWLKACHARPAFKAMWAARDNEPA